VHYTSARVINLKVCALTLKIRENLLVCDLIFLYV
jgi:hypothetical protein